MKLLNLRKKMSSLLKESKWLFEDEYKDEYEEKAESETEDAEYVDEEYEESDIKDISSLATEELQKEKERISNEAFEKLSNKSVTINEEGREVEVTITKAYWAADDVLMFSGESVDPESGHKSIHTLI